MHATLAALAWRAQTGGRTGVREERRDKFGRREAKGLQGEDKEEVKETGESWGGEERLVLLSTSRCFRRVWQQLFHHLHTRFPLSASSSSFVLHHSASLHLPSTSSCCFYLSSHLISLLILFQIPLGVFLWECIFQSFFKVFVLVILCFLWRTPSFSSCLYFLPLVVSVSII